MKTHLLFSPDLTVEVDVTRLGHVLIHKALGDGKGYALTDARTLKIMAWAPLKGTAVSWRRQVERAIEAGRDDEYLCWLLHFLRVNQA